MPFLHRDFFFLFVPPFVSFLNKKNVCGFFFFFQTAAEVRVAGDGVGARRSNSFNPTFFSEGQSLGACSKISSALVLAQIL